MKKKQPTRSKRNVVTQLEILFPEMSPSAVIIYFGMSLQKSAAGRKTSLRDNNPAGRKTVRSKKRSVVTRVYYKKVKESR